VAAATLVGKERGRVNDPKHFNILFAGAPPFSTFDTLVVVVVRKAAAEMGMFDMRPRSLALLYSTQSGAGRGGESGRTRN